MTDATDVRDPTKDSAENVNSGTAGRQTARRRLMLGAAAALPSVFTLTSGAQTAVASNARCFAPGVRDSKEVPFFTMDHDGWLRKQVYYGRSNNGRIAYCAMDDQAACVDPINPAKPAIGSVWMDHGYRQTVDSASIRQISAGPQAYALVYVDQQGTIATLDPGTRPDVEPIKETCWTSILGGRISPLG